MCVVGDVSESTVPIVMEERVAVDSGHVKIGPAIVVKVGRGPPYAVSEASHSGFVSHIRKSAVVVVAIKPVREAVFILLKTRQTCPVREVNVQIAVIVVIQQGDATKNAIDDRFIF